MAESREHFLTRRTLYLFAGLVVLASFAPLYLPPESRVAAENLPPRLSDDEFWRIVREFSEPNGFFRSDNFVSNETTFQHVIPALRERAKPGGVYIGVGPDQNFTYIAAIRPKLAFIVDIRRQNMLQHLMYKALIEMSDNRAQFLSKLFSRPVPADLPDNASAEQLLEAFSKSEGAASVFEENLAAVLRRLTEYHKFKLEPGDPKTIEYVYRAFANAGAEIRYTSPSQWSWRRFPSYSELMLESDQLGQNHSYVATEENFQILRELESQNRIVPLVGDFAGDKCLRVLGGYLKEHGAAVTAFYTSNVEFYLFQSDDWKRYYTNVSDLPLDENSTFIRSYFNNYGFRFANQTPGARSITLLDSMAGLVAAFEQGRIRNYPDVIRRSR